MPLLSFAFRPMFLLAGGFAVVAMLVWILVFRGSIQPYGGAVSIWWHVHEMTIGFAGAVVAGFLLTAVATWTGRQPLRGMPVVALAVTWLAGRIAVFVAAPVPAAVLDMLFPVLLAVLAGREIIAGRSRRNYVIAAAIWAIPALNLLYHLGALGIVPAGSRVAGYLLVHLLALLVVIIGGRVVPAFTGNWLKFRGGTNLPVLRPAIEAIVIPLTAAAALADSLWTGSLAAGLLLTVAGLVHLARLLKWRGWAARADALVFVLHGAYACLAIGYLFIGVGALGAPIPRTAAMHALTVGGIAGMILAMMTRVSLGHTGRPLKAASTTVVAYVALAIATVLRVAGPLSGGGYGPLLDAAAGAWILAFTLFLVVYAPILTTARPDSRPAPGPAA